MNKKLIWGIIIVVMAALVIFTLRGYRDYCSSTGCEMETNDKITADWKMYTNDKHGFELRYPHNWYADEIRDNQHSSLQFSKEEIIMNDSKSHGRILGTLYITKLYTLKDATTTPLAYFRTYHPADEAESYGPEVEFKSESRYIGNIPVHYTYTDTRKVGGDIEVRYRMFTSDTSYMFVLHTGPESYPTSLDLDRDFQLIQEIIKTIRFKDPSTKFINIFE